MNNQETEIETSSNKLKAKDTSLIAQIIAALWVAGWSAFYFIKNIESIKIENIIFSGFAIAGCFSPVYFNILMDKIKGLKFGND